MPPLSIPKWGPVGVRVSLKVESRPLPLRHLASECLQPPATDIWGTHEPPEPSLQARESLLSTGENQRAQETSRHPWASPAACSWHEPRHPPHRPCQTVGQTARSAIHTRDGSRQPPLGWAACVCVAFSPLSSAGLFCSGLQIHF